MSYILIVQDCPNIADVTIRILSKHGYAAYAVPNSAEALDVLQDSTTLPCLILLDICTPVMDGVAFHFTQKRNPRLCAIPVVTLSSYSNVLRYGAHHLFDNFLYLPFSPKELITMVAQYCGSTITTKNAQE